MPTRTVTTKFFDFSQNNSGGRWVFDKEKGLTCNVIIEAQNAADANRIAEEKGIYFNGCSTGDDCSCCGDRWSSQWDDEKGDAVPSIYGEPVGVKESHRARWCDDVLPIAVHYLDGTIEWFN
jgi:hypothetical protein